MPWVERSSCSACHLSWLTINVQVATMAHDLEVWLFADRVGTLALVDGRLSFSYASEWLVQSDVVALSASLSLQAESFNDRKTRPFFAGLLPEGQMRRLIAQQFQVSGQNDFALLDHSERFFIPTFP